MVPKVWTYVLVGALVVDLVLSASGQVAVVDGLLTGPLRVEEIVALVALVASVVAVVAGVAIVRSLLRARDELERRAQVIDAAEAMSDDWLWESDVEGTLTYSSIGVTELLGYAPAEVVGRSTFELLYDDASRTQARLLLTTSVTARTGWDDAQLRWRHRDGSPVSLHGAAVVLKGHGGELVGYRGARRPADRDEISRHERAEQRQRIESALATNDVDMALQPLVSLVTGEVAGVEALARFRDGRSPDQWFADATSCGRLKDLDELTFTAALRLFAKLPDLVYLSVNASPELLVDRSFCDRLCGSRLPLDRLVIEITEHAQVADYPTLNTSVNRLRGQGVRFAIDDTGAGYASLNHVLELRPEIIKLDRALIDNVDSDPARRALVTALVLLALEIGASVTGEGVETSDQLSALSTLGVDHAQGYLLARPSTDRSLWPDWWSRRWAGALTV